MTDKTWPEWQDTLGQTFKAGDYVAIATVNDKSPQLVIGQVERINRINSKGEEITTGKWEDRPCDANDRDARPNREWNDIDNRWEDVPGYIKYEWITTPSCTVTVMPMHAGRGFRRYGGQKKVTYKFPGNIVRLSQETVDSLLSE